MHQMMINHMTQKMKASGNNNIYNLINNIKTPNKK